MVAWYWLVVAFVGGALCIANRYVIAFLIYFWQQKNKSEFEKLQKEILSYYEE